VQITGPPEDLGLLGRRRSPEEEELLAACADGSDRTEGASTWL